MASRAGGAQKISSTGSTTRIVNPGLVILPWAPTSPASNQSGEQGTHDPTKSFGVVYVNDLALRATQGTPSIQLPRGSIIVREKLASVTDIKPQILAVMIKRTAGFNPKANDWEFLTIDGAMTRVEERQKEGSCLECHKSQANRDFVYSYSDTH